MTQLRELRVTDNCVLQPDGGQFEPYSRAADAAATAALLAAVAHMTRLRLLNLGFPVMDISGASSELQQVRIASSDHLPLPRGAVRHMFPKGKQWPQLESVHLERELFVEDEVNEVTYSWCMTASDIRRIHSSCPKLTSLGICCVIKPAFDVSALLELSGCESLYVGGAAFGDAVASVITRLSGLTHLSWTCSPVLTDVGLEHLTALQGLRCLQLHFNTAVSARVVPGASYYGLKSSKQAGAVWQQLDKLCDKSPLLAPRRLKVQRQRNEELQATVAELQQQLADARQRCTGCTGS